MKRTRYIWFLLANLSPHIQHTGKPSPVSSESKRLPTPSPYLDGLIRAAVQVVLGSHQCPNPVIQTSQLLLQLQLRAHDVPHL